LYGARFRQKYSLDDAIGSHACLFEVSKRVANCILLGCSLLLPIGTVNPVQTLKAAGECHCNDLAAPHVHERSTLDRQVKTTVLAGAIELLPVVRDTLGLDEDVVMQMKGSKKDGNTPSNSYSEATSQHGPPLERCLRLIERMYVQCGRVKKAFNPNVLKRELGKFSGLFHKKFTKPDLTILTAPYRDLLREHKSVKETASDEGELEDSTVVKFGALIIAICIKSYQSPDHLLTRIIAMLSGALEDDEIDPEPEPELAPAAAEGGGADSEFGDIRQEDESGESDEEDDEEDGKGSALKQMVSQPVPPSQPTPALCDWTSRRPVNLVLRTLAGSCTRMS
jgi:hypothetical protein